LRLLEDKLKRFFPSARFRAGRRKGAFYKRGGAWPDFLSRRGDNYSERAPEYAFSAYSGRRCKLRSVRYFMTGLFIKTAMPARRRGGI